VAIKQVSGDERNLPKSSFKQGKIQVRGVEPILLSFGLIVWDWWPIAMDFVLVMGWIWGWVIGYCFIENCT